MSRANAPVALRIAGSPVEAEVGVADHVVGHVDVLPRQLTDLESGVVVRNRLHQDLELERKIGRVSRGHLLQIEDAEKGLDKDWRSRQIVGRGFLKFAEFPVLFRPFVGILNLQRKFESLNCQNFDLKFLSSVGQERQVYKSS